MHCASFSNDKLGLSKAEFRQGWKIHLLPIFDSAILCFLIINRPIFSALYEKYRIFVLVAFY